MSAYPDYLPLGPAPRPATGAELLDRVRHSVRHLGIGGAMAAGVDAIVDGTSVTLDGDDVTSAAVDATGVVIPESAITEIAISGSAERTAAPSAPLPTVTAALPGTLHVGTFQAHPITVAEVPVTIDAEVRNLPIQWIEAADGSVGVEPLPPTDEAPITGHLHLSAPQTAVIEAVRRIATVLAAEQSITLVRLDVDLNSAGPRDVHFRAEAKLRRGILSASAHITAAVSIDDDLVLRFSDVALGSANPIVAGLLAVARGRIQAATARPIDLAEQLPPGVRVQDVRLGVGTDLTLDARLT